jgi:hypothetical protein
LEAQGWAVTRRRGDTFDCKPAPVKARKAKPKPRVRRSREETVKQGRLELRALSDPFVARACELFDCELVSVTELLESSGGPVSPASLRSSARRPHNRQ